MRFWLENFRGPVTTGLSEESKVEFHGLAKSRNERPLTIIDEPMLNTALQIIGFEQTTELMKLVQTQTNSTFNQSVLQFIANGVQITIQIDPDMNRVVEVKLVDV
ncbi:hypothetical protein [Pseudoalteromonas luteoviolacea]|uniref:Uncharacterized protein n=1 Tax=Pseudoalteromonas luteoviolacea S4054 TaxID=1129367 RepID=A0A0F6ADB4_9GAMM|nr:hypothetical protein [Pseudoalteromonas luteoviolacea]AOT08221.1 hypothetical protein S4054249_10390 [Pseudoalteromonas luteoviolacea]AOT13137.1 hypothetical protein S40542_10365 [Pseudoalteromonas luteoviolacea]AOT18049.1 hypothetical protein S4054_10360 [Pseudoalteromonas luteoviolacea]KKE84153.1 hypothetical protein N479_09645 [Pseudoalteromonas luteoviolacea S4054]KZN76242.1 hypothetical protein N481_07770 [Pseudoalteromonas luteoviolacea S4047-1]